MPQKLTAEIIVAAIEGFESQKRRIDSRMMSCVKLLNVTAQKPSRFRSPARKRKVSALAAEGWQQHKKQGGPRFEETLRLHHPGRSQAEKAKKKAKCGWQEGHQ